MKISLHFWRTGTFVLLVVALAGLTACSQLRSTSYIQAEELMNEQRNASITGLSPDDAFISSTADFSIQLLQATFEDRQKTLISPLSVLQALAMTANGADRETFAQMEDTLGKGIKLADLNSYLYAYTRSLADSGAKSLKQANSIWFKDNEDLLTIEESFLQTNADYYNAAVYRAAFDGRTLEDINRWVHSNTDGMIDRIASELGPSDVLVLLNAVALDAEWETPYPSESVRKDTFIAADGSLLTLDMMHSSESWYINDGQATGFMKPYADQAFSFVALLPDEGTSIAEFVASMTGESWLRAVNGAQPTAVRATLPKFTDEFALSLNETLQKLGMTDAFSSQKADFTKLGRSPLGNLFIGQVLHKTFIAVNEQGTRAGAAAAVLLRAGSAPGFATVKLDRPFVYAIIDQQTKLPVFLGTMTGQ